MKNSAIGRWSSLIVFLFGVAYAVALVVGFSTHGLSTPIGDPLLAVMETLTLLAAPVLLVMFAAMQKRAPREYGTTCSVHFVALTSGRQTGNALLVWPSTPYAVELLAWDGFFGLALLFAAPTFRSAGRERGVRLGLLLSAALCLAGLVGPVVGDMRLQLVGVVGYGVVLPIVALLLSRLFRAESEGAAPSGT